MLGRGRSGANPGGPVRGAGSCSLVDNLLGCWITTTTTIDIMSAPAPTAVPVGAGAGASSTQNKVRKPAHPVVRWYLFAYNTVCFFLWGVTFATLVKFVLLGPQKATPSTIHAYVTQGVMHLLKSEPTKELVPFEWNGTTNPRLAVLYWHLRNTYAYMGDFVAATQTLALLEIVHAALGLVRSPIPTTVVQVGSRLWSVWGVTYLFPSAATSPFYPTMIFAWSVTETIRYAFYAEQLLIEGSANSEPSWQLLWARYTTFYALYPLGAGSEIACMVYTLPPLNPTAIWDVRAYAYLALALLWVPGTF